MITELKLFTETNYLLNQIKAVTKTALDKGALQPIQTDYEEINCQGFPFLVRIINNLARKEQETQPKIKEKKPENFNPFLPFDRDLFVSDISPSHLCVLNKYNVVDNHLLIITKAFEDQETIITPADFFAVSTCLHQIDGLVFYNSGKIAGASVKHKHLQLVPFPLSPFLETFPLEIVVKNLAKSTEFFTLPQFTFKHIFAKINPQDFTKLETANHLNDLYLKLLETLAIKIEDNRPNQAYNLLLTRQWMLIVPRTKESYQNISINGLGFAGLLLVKNQEQLNILKQTQPINILKEIASITP